MYDFVLQVKTFFLNYYRSNHYKKIISLMFVVAILFIPNKDDYTNGMIFDRNYRGYFDSNWAGTSLAIIYIFLIAVFGYYIIKDRGKMLNNLSVNKLIGSTQIDKGKFVLCVFVSKFLILLTTTIPIVIVACIAQLIKGESLNVNILQICMPFIIFAIPALLLIVSITCYFDTIEGLTGIAGNILYFILCFFVLPLENLKLGWSPLGVGCVTEQICSSLSKYVGKSVTGVTILGNGYVYNKFLFEGIDYSAGVLIGRGITVFISIFILRGAMRNYEFFTESFENNLESKTNSIKEYRCVKSINKILLNLGLYDMPIYFADIRLNRIIILIVFMVLSFLINTSFINVILFLIPMDIISKLILYGKENNFANLIKSTNYYHRQILISWLSGILILLMTNALVLVKYLMLGNFTAISVVVVGCCIICSISILLGELTTNENIFQISYLLLLYIMADGQLYTLDFTGRSASLWDDKLIISYFIISLLVIMLLMIKRNYEYCKYK